MVKNDERIEQLKKDIEKKRSEIGKTLRFEPITSCVFEFRNKNININVLDVEQLGLLTVELSLLKNEAENIEIDISINGNDIKDLFTDAKNKLAVIKQKEKLKSLEVVEKQLNKLLSDEKQKSLAIDELAGKI